MTPKDNPLEKNSWSAQLSARVVEPGEHPRIYGYDVQRDLAKHYRWSEVLFLSLVGELPAEEYAVALELAFIFLSPLSTAEAPGHTALLAGLCGTTNSAMVAATSITLTEEARFNVESYLTHKDKTSRNTSEGARELQELLRARGLSHTAAQINLESPTWAALSLLELCGLTTPSQLEAAWFIARLPAAIAEGWRQPIGQFTKYPTLLPTFIYEDPRRKEKR